MRKVTGHVISLASILVLWACSSEPPPAPSGQSGTNESAANESPSSSSSGGATSKGGSSGSAGTCSADQGVEACYECCDQKHGGGSEVYEEAWVACACQPSVCGTQCASSLCGVGGVEPQEGDDCATCLEGAAQCDEQADTACQADASCAASFQCALDSKCEDFGEDEEEGEEE